MSSVVQNSALVVELENSPCEICGQNNPIPVASRTDLFLGGDVIYTMQCCPGCGVIYQHPRPTAATIGTLYPPEYPQYTVGLHREKKLRRIDRRYGLWKRCRIVQRHVKGGRLLDVGCATGDFLSEMKLRPGWSGVGIEPNHVAAHYAHVEAGLDVVEGILNTAPFADQSFDAITMWDVFEHVYDPRLVIQAAARLLRPGGVFVINHPNLDSLDRRLFGRFWIGYELPRHIYLFPTVLLRELMAEYGLCEVERLCSYGCHAASATSITFAAEHFFGKYIGRLVKRIAFSMPVRVLLIPYFKFISSRRLGSNVIVTFQRTR
jgi:2-polyprenyl-3-methyl-5-hydroxy-6-metoxy-1,4-benzoquinol methylase